MNSDIAVINQLTLLLREIQSCISSPYKFYMSFRLYPIDILSLKICVLTF